jgi:hypothetical protein
MVKPLSFGTILIPNSLILLFIYGFVISPAKPSEDIINIIIINPRKYKVFLVIYSNPRPPPLLFRLPYLSIPPQNQMAFPLMWDWPVSILSFI